MTSMLAVKFRPKKFADVQGQQHVVAPLKNSIKNKNLSQAILLHGPSGTGKTTLARIVAKSINCTQQSDGEPCGSCPSCKRIDAETSPDIIEFDAATNGGVNEIREIQTLVGAASLASKFRVFILDEAHMLTAQASNALLKTLEEPPKNIIFILATTELNKILPTIRTRCQKYALSPIKTEDIREYLGKIAKSIELEVEPQALNLICRGSQGGMREAIQFLEKISNLGQKKIAVKDVIENFGAVSFNLLFSFFSNIIEGKSTEVIMYWDKMSQDGISLPTFWGEFQQLLRAANFIKHIKDLDKISGLIHFDESMLKKLARSVISIDQTLLLNAWKNAIETQNQLELPSIAGRIREVVEEASLRMALFEWTKSNTKATEQKQQSTATVESVPEKESVVDESFENGLPIFGSKFVLQ